ncbi:MAG: hypothetical protein D6772_13075 [Bacteroidetes bacterium]|nr:MAG: hypothetical protein D6772_13075 [Bacteroidota bacterium]
MLDKDRIKRLHAALAGAKMMPYKADMLASYGVESSKNLTVTQAEELIQRLNDMKPLDRTEAPKPVRRLRSTVLTLINSLGIYATNNDWTRVNQFLLNPRIAGKLLYQMNEEELKALARKLRGMIRKRKEKVEQEAFLATNN